MNKTLPLATIFMAVLQTVLWASAFANVSEPIDNTFNLPENAENSAANFSYDTQVLEQYKEYIDTLKSIKENGDDKLLLEVLRRFDNEPEMIATIKKAFALMPKRQQEPKTLSQNKHTNAPKTGTKARAKEKITHPLIPVFAQIADENTNKKTKAIISVGGKGYILIPGDTFFANNRTYTLTKLAESDIEGSKEKQVWISEEGKAPYKLAWIKR